MDYNEKALEIQYSENSLTLTDEQKITFINELWVGKVKIPIKTELDFTSVHHSQQERILKLAKQIYYKDRKINSC